MIGGGYMGLQARTLAELQEQIAAAYPALTPHEQLVAQFIMDNPASVAMLSMRKLADAANVSSYSVIRFFKKFNFSQFDEIKRLATDSLIMNPLNVVERTRDSLANNDAESQSLLATQLNLVLAAARHPDSSELDRLAGIFMKAKINYIIGFRTSSSLAQHFYHCGQNAHKNMLLVTGIGNQSIDNMAEIGSGDVVFVLSFKPYTVMAVKLCMFAKSKGARIVTMTDSKLSPLYRLADDSIFVQADGPSYFNSLVAPVIILERLLGRMHQIGSEKAEIRIKKYRNFHKFLDRHAG